MDLTVKGCACWGEQGFTRRDLSVSGGAISNAVMSGDTICFDDCVLLPGLIDVHVHFREPGFSYKETIRTGSMAAARGGYTRVCPMPNLDPVPDSAEHLQEELSLIRRDAVIDVIPYGAATVGEKGERLSDIHGMAPNVCAFSDDGRGIQSESVMREVMLSCAAEGKILAAHCEDNALLRGGYIHDGQYARAHGHKGICSESEWGPIARDLRLAKETGCRYHVCHVSCKESVRLIREAKKEGVDVTCETGPHYLLMDDSMLEEDGRFKMNPPIREKADREALVEGLLDGTIDMIATDHAPHSAEEKAKGLQGSLMGVVGLETAFPVLYTGLVKTGVMTLEALVDRMSCAPARRFGFPCGLKAGGEASFTVFDLKKTVRIDPNRFVSKGRATPFAGWTVSGQCLMTVCGGRVVYRAGEE